MESNVRPGTELAAKDGELLSPGLALMHVSHLSEHLFHAKLCVRADVHDLFYFSESNDGFPTTSLPYLGMRAPCVLYSSIANRMLRYGSAPFQSVWQ